MLLTREPGGTDVGARLRSILLDPATGALSPRTEALVYAADKAEHVDAVVLPALKRGEVVVTDRYVDSTLAYQGAGRAIDAAELEHVARDLFDRTGRPATFGWGPRFLHSTGQYHKGGPATGVYVQVTTAPVDDLAVQGRDFTLGQFIAAQAAGDASVLADHGRPVLRLHLTDIAAGVAAVRAALQ